MKNADGTDRKCGECGKVIYYGLFCSNYCSNLNYERWRKHRVIRCQCGDCAKVNNPEER